MRVNINRSSDFHDRCKKQVLKMNVSCIIGLLICLLYIGGAWKIRVESQKIISNYDIPETDTVPMKPLLAMERIFALKIMEKGNTNIQNRKKGQEKESVPVIRIENPFCDPENVTVPLSIEPVKGITFWPTHVRLLRCGGCCKQSYRSCQPTVKRKYRVKVRKYADNYRRHHKRKNHFYVDVEQHEACACKCKINDTECNPVTHTFDKKLCLCNCNDKDRMISTCSKNHMWDDVRCRCKCRNVHHCSKSEVIDDDSCMCKSRYEDVIISEFDL